MCLVKHPTKIGTRELTTNKERGYKLNIGASSLGNPGIGGTGGVIGDKDGDWIIGYMSNIAITNNIKAELLALLQV